MGIKCHNVLKMLKTVTQNKHLKVICRVFFKCHCGCEYIAVYYSKSCWFILPLHSFNKINTWLEIPFPFLGVRILFLNKQMDAPPLSPYPFVRTGSPRRIQLSQNHPVYISPHKNETMLSPREKIFYYFSNSPSKVSLT